MTANPRPPMETKNVAIYFRRKNRRILHIWLSLAHLPGTMREALAALPVPHVNILHLSASNGSRDGIATAHIYAETDPTITPEMVEKSLRAVPSVQDVRIETDIDGHLIDGSYPLHMAEGPQLMLFRRESFAQALTELRNAMGSGGAVLLYEFGEHIGAETWSNVIERVGPDLARDHPSYLARVFSAMGLGEVEVAELDPAKGTATLRVTDSFECPRGHKTPSPYSQLLRGVLAGFFSKLLACPVSCKETRCVGEGAPECEFRVERVRAPPANEILPG